MGHCVVVTVAVCGFGSWDFLFHCGLPCQISSSPPNPSQTRPGCAQGNRWEKSQERLLFAIQRCPRISTEKFASCRYWLPPILQTVRVLASNLAFHRSAVTHKAETALKDRSVVPWSHSLPSLRFQHRCLCSSRRSACTKVSAIQAFLHESVFYIRFLAPSSTPEHLSTESLSHRVRLRMRRVDARAVEVIIMHDH